LAPAYIDGFKMPVNTFPGRLSFSIDGKMLVPGKDYLVDPASAGVNERAMQIVRADKNFFENYKSEQDKLRGEKFALVIDAEEIGAYKGPALARKINYLHPAVVIELHSGKLTWSVSRTKLRKAYIWLNKELLPLEAKSINLEIEEKFYKRFPVKNLIGYIEGSKYPDSFLVLSAHYEHLGKMGKATYFPGANDNASGTAILLDIMRYFARPENKPQYSVCFMLFTGEEAGLVGSKHYTDKPVFPLERIKFLINLDLLANGQDGMMVVNGAVFPTYFEKLEKLNAAQHYLKEIKKRGKAPNSDHYYFSEHDVKAFFFYLLGTYPYYHDIYDTPDKPTFAGYNGAFKLIVAFLKGF
jgi:aminopeptidase YwaD